MHRPNAPRPSHTATKRASATDESTEESDSGSGPKRRLHSPPQAGAPPNRRNKWQIGDHAAASDKAPSAGTVTEVRGNAICVAWPDSEPEWFHYNTLAHWKLPTKRKAAREASRRIAASPTKKKKNAPSHATATTPHNTPGSKCDQVTKPPPHPPSTTSLPH